MAVESDGKALTKESHAALVVNKHALTHQMLTNHALVNHGIPAKKQE